MKRILYVVIALILIVGGFIYFSWLSQPSANTSPPTTEATTTPPVSNFTLTPTTLTFQNGKAITLQIPQSYSMSIAAQGFNHTRFMAMSPDHRLFVGEMTSASDTNTGRVLVFDGFDPSTGKFAASHIYLSNLRNPNSVSFYTDHQGQSWIYIALTDKLIRYRYSAGDNAPQSEGEVLAHFPDYGKPVSEGGWHLTRTLAWNDDQLFVSVGSSCNSCEETEPIRGVILTMNPDGSNSRVYASGLRNAVGITYAAGALFATANEADHLGNDRPDDVVYKIIDGTNYGWPYCYQFGDAVYADASQTWQQPFDCSKVPLAWAVLPPHSAPLGITFFDASFSDPALQNAFLVAMHGSGKPALATGYQVALVRTGSAPIPFIDGFLQNDTRVGRPVAILQNDANSFFVSDDLNGAIYYLHYDR